MLTRIATSDSAQNSLEHIVVSLTTRGKVAAQLSASGVPVYALGLHSVIYAPIAAIRLALIIQRTRPHLIQCWMYHADLFGGLVARLVTKCPVLWGVRQTLLVNGDSRSTYFIRWLCARLSHVIPTKVLCVAEAAKESHISLGYAREKMVTLPNGVDTHVLRRDRVAGLACRAGWGLKPDAVVIGSVASYKPGKDHRTLLLALFPTSADRQVR
jgi:glycosyltransferase involved in cell wall biosynthesis